MLAKYLRNWKKTSHERESVRVSRSKASTRELTTYLLSHSSSQSQSIFISDCLECTGEDHSYYLTSSFFFYQCCCNNRKINLSFCLSSTNQAFFLCYVCSIDFIVIFASLLPALVFQSNDELRRMVRTAMIATKNASWNHETTMPRSM